MIKHKLHGAFGENGAPVITRHQLKSTEGDRTIESGFFAGISRYAQKMGSFFVEK